MDVHPVWALVPGSLPPNGGVAAALPPLTQPSFPARQPFEAYLLSLTDPADIAQAAILRSTPAVATGLAAGNGSTLTNLLATAQAYPGTAAASAGSAAGLALEPAVAAAALPIVQTPEAAETPGTSQGEAEPAAQAAPAQASADNPGPDQSLVAGAVAPALIGISPADVLAAEFSSLAIDSTAKFMGGGAMGEPARALSTYQAIQDAIPAVNQVLAASAMAANTSSHSGGRAFGQTAAHPASKASSPNAAGAFGLDLLT